MADAEYRAASLAAGFDYYVVKPCDAEVLAACLNLGNAHRRAPLAIPNVDHHKLEALSARSRAVMEQARKLVRNYPFPRQGR